MSALFELPFRPPENEKSRSPHNRRNRLGWNNLPSEKKRRRSVSLVLGISGKGGRDRLKRLNYMLAPFLERKKAGSLEHNASRNPAEISIDNFLKTKDFCGALFDNLGYLKKGAASNGVSTLPNGVQIPFASLKQADASME